MDEGNLNDIININHASANISSEFFNGQENRLNNILRYQEKNKLLNFPSRYFQTKPE